MFRDDLELERELIGKSLEETHLEFGDLGALSIGTPSFIATVMLPPATTSSPGGPAPGLRPDRSSA